MLDFGFATSDEIGRELGSRLRAARLSQGLQQVEVAARAGVSRNTVNTLENKGQANLNNFLRVVMALGLVDELAPLFKLKASSIAELERNERAIRKRAPRRPRATKDATQ